LNKAMPRTLPESRMSGAATAERMLLCIISETLGAASGAAT